MRAAGATRNKNADPVLLPHKNVSTIPSECENRAYVFYGINIGIPMEKYSFLCGDCIISYGNDFVKGKSEFLMF